mmetsp:Transcript_11790/g.25948  ORF Transcript_11790/g.25948 Transcript_11790/m.25948 type:complete len:621 (+) Transcript_11790:56-1918(+)
MTILTRRLPSILASIAFILSTTTSSTSSVTASTTYSEYEEKINHHLQEGNNALATGDLPLAAEHYESCLKLDPNQRYCLINYASTLVDLNESSADANETKEQRLEKAISLLRQVMTLHPKDGDAAFNLALLLQDSSRSEDFTKQAANLYQIAVEASIAEGEERWDAWANMAAAKQELGQFTGPFGARRGYERSIVFLEQMVEEQQSWIDDVLNGPEAESLEWDENRYHEVQTEIIAMNAYLSKMYYGYGTVLSEFTGEDCLKLMDEETLMLDMIDGIDEEEAKKVCDMNALNAMRMAVDLDGNNIVAAHMLDAMTGGEDDEDETTAKQRASNEFVSALFDDFADTFDEKLGALGYQVPQLVGEAAFYLMKQSGREMYNSVLDAGCGTGLAGRFLRPLVEGPLVGVDLSTKMLELAAKCSLKEGCGLKVEETVGDSESAAVEEAEEDVRSSTRLYDHLKSLDLETATLDELYSGYESPLASGDGFDLIVAADVLVYFGDIQKLLTNFAKLNNQNEDAFLIFSCERIEEADAPSTGWKLQPSGRYAHSKSYVVKVAKEAGYRLIGYEEIVPRMEKGEPVQGHLFQLAFGEEILPEDFEDIEEMVFYEYDGGGEREDSVKDEL